MVVVTRWHDLKLEGMGWHGYLVFEPLNLSLHQHVQGQSVKVLATFKLWKVHLLWLPHLNCWSLKESLNFNQVERRLGKHKGVSNCRRIGTTMILFIRYRLIVKFSWSLSIQWLKPLKSVTIKNVSICLVAASFLETLKRIIRERLKAIFSEHSKFRQMHKCPKGHAASLAQCASRSARSAWWPLHICRLFPKIPKECSANVKLQAVDWSLSKYQERPYLRSKPSVLANVWGCRCHPNWSESEMLL